MDINSFIKAPFLYFIIRYWKTFTLAMTALVVTNFLDAFSPYVIGQAINAINQNQPSQDVIYWGGLFLIILAILALTRYFWRVFFARYHVYASEDLRQTLFKKLLYMDISFFNKKTTGEMVSLLINDIQAFRAAIGNGILVTIDGILISLFILPLMYWLHPPWLLPILIFAPFLPFAIKYITSKIYLYFKNQQEDLASLSQFIQETINGIRIIKSFSCEANRLKQFKNYNDRLLQSSESLALFDASFGPVMELAVAVGSIILVFIAMPDLLSGVVSIGSFVAYQRYITKMVWPMTSLGLGISQFQKGRASLKRIKEVLLHDNHISSGERLLTQVDTIEFKDVSFSYEPHMAQTLEKINWIIKRGEKVGIIGPIGSGKSTLVYLLVRFFDPHQGQILINSYDLKSYHLGSLREKIVLVTQEPILFSLSIRDNIKLVNKNISDEEIWKWLKVVDLDKEINQLPQGLATRVGEKGVNFSGGQKQRLALARALATNSEVLILDDPLSAVDLHTEEVILNNLKQISLTIIIISHRLNVLKNCSKLILINQGKIQGEGSFAELQFQSSYFRNLATAQGLISS